MEPIPLNKLDPRFYFIRSAPQEKIVYPENDSNFVEIEKKRSSRNVFGGRFLAPKKAKKFGFFVTGWNEKKEKRSWT